MEVFGDVAPFFVKNEDLAPRSRQSILQNSNKKAYLLVETAAVVDAGREFVKSTYKLKGDGAVVLESY